MMPTNPSPPPSFVRRLAKEIAPRPAVRLVREGQQQIREAQKPWRKVLDTFHDARGGSRFATAAALARVHTLPRRTVLCYPGNPSRYQVSYRLFLLLGYKTATSPKERYDAVLVFQPGTVYPAIDFSPVDASGIWPTDMINRYATDVSKTTVEQTFEQVFGYSVGVDPSTFEGLIVRKSDENNTHDGQILEGPFELDAGEETVTYQRYVDTRTPDGFFLDLRVPLYDGEIPLVYLRYKADNERRFIDVDHAELAAADDVFSKEEQRQLAALAKTMGVDYCEMDVLRDIHDGRIYVVDVNPRPAGLIKGMTQAQRREILRTLAPAFERMVERRVASAQRSRA